MPQLLGEELGKGAHGKVYKALDLQGGEFVAIKEVSLDNMSPEDLASIMVGGNQVVKRSGEHCGKISEEQMR